MELLDNRTLTELGASVTVALIGWLLKMRDDVQRLTTRQSIQIEHSEKLNEAEDKINDHEKRIAVMESILQQVSEVVRPISATAARLQTLLETSLNRITHLEDTVYQSRMDKK